MDYNVKIKDIEDKMPDMTLLTSLQLMLLLLLKIKYLTLVICQKSRLCCENIRNGKKIYFTTFDYNKFTNNILDGKMKEKN